MFATETQIQSVPFTDTNPSFVIPKFKPVTKLEYFNIHKLLGGVLVMVNPQLLPFLFVTKATGGPVPNPSFFIPKFKLSNFVFADQSF